MTLNGQDKPPTTEQLHKINVIEERLFRFFKGQNSDEAERFIVCNWHEANKSNDIYSNKCRRKSKKRFNGSTNGFV